MDLIRSFAHLSRIDLPLAGGKGANLGEMARAGLPVPPGFVLLTPAYVAFVAANGLQAEIVRLASQVVPDDTASVEGASVAIRSLFEQGTVPEAVAQAVADAYRDLGGGPVAVRSSATAEDLPGASFAGQQETYLNITGPEAVLTAVRRCWSSLWTPRAISYRARQGIRPEDVTLAVVVQHLVMADTAGVLFTANPVNGRRDQMVIDGAWGLGESVVSGAVTPDHWVTDSRTGTILEERLADKEVWTVRGEGGSETVPLPPDLRGKACLTTGQLAALTALGRQVAAHYGEPQDIEWAIENGQLFLVQARPITSLFPMPEPAAPPELGLRTYMSFNSLQGLTEPFTPAGIAVFKLVSHGIARILWGLDLPPGQPAPVLKVAACRMWLDATGGLCNQKLRRPLLGLTGQLDRPLSDCLRHLVEREPERLGINLNRQPFRPPLRFALPNVFRLIRALFFPAHALRRDLATIEAEITRLELQAGCLTTVGERVDFVQRLTPVFHPLLVGKLFGPLAVGMGARYLASVKTEAWLGTDSVLAPVFRGLPNNPTTEMDLDLWRVSRQLKADGVEPTPDHPAVQRFLARYGHRTAREIDAGVPRWSDDPSPVLTMLRAHLQHDDADDPVDHFQKGAAAAEEAAAALVARVRQEKGLLRGWFMQLLLNRLRVLGGVREYPKFYFVKLAALDRAVLMAAGKDLAAAGRLSQPDDVFFLEPAELLASGTDLMALVEARRTEYMKEMGRRSVPRVITSEGETFYGAPQTDPHALTGIAASPGVCEGTARVILEPAGAKLEPGEILVAPGTDPAWTPLFLTAGALVMEIGGPMSHGSVVAREYGIPAVVGVAGATTRIQTGQRIRVDGETGSVTPLE